MAILGAHTVKTVPNVHVADRTRYVSNPDGVISLDAQVRADSIIADIWRSTTAEVTVAVINDFDDQDNIDDFATRLFEEWGIGKKDKSNGVLVVVAKDRRKAAIRTGYGVEGVLPDVVASRILRNSMFPYFKDGDYDNGLIEGLMTIREVLVNPENADEITSAYANDADADTDMGDAFYFYLIICAFIALALLGWLIGTLIRTRKLSDFEKYNALESMKSVGLFSAFLGLGMPLIAVIPMLLIMRRLREKPHICANCGASMRKLDEQTDNNYLTPSQDLEERIDSIDYDVWLCPQCNATDVLPYVNRHASYTTCDHCGARTLTLSSDNVIKRPTTSSEGMGEKVYTCLNCHNIKRRRYNIAKLAQSGVVVLPHGGSGGGGGFSGGSFGGGFTGGGGASGGW